MERRRGILSFLSSNRQTKEVEEHSIFINGRCNEFSAKELVKATNNFDQLVFEEDTKTYQGTLKKHPILVKFCRDHGPFPSISDPINDIVFTSQMSHHKNVLKLIGCCQEFKVPALVYECAGTKRLSDLLYVTKNGGSVGHKHDDGMSLSWKSRIRIAKDIANTVSYLHTAFPTPIIFRNLRPETIIIDQFGVAKLFDFSLSTTLPPGESQMVDCVIGINITLAPEYVAAGIVSDKCDVHNFGMLLCILLTGRRAISRHNKFSCLKDLVRDCVEKHQLKKIVDPIILGEKGGVEQEQQLQAFVAIALRCLEREREDRPEMIDVAKELGRIERSSLPEFQGVHSK